MILHVKDKVTSNGVTFAKTIKPGIDCKSQWASQGVVPVSLAKNGKRDCLHKLRK